MADFYMVPWGTVYVMYCIHHTLGIQIIEHMSSCTVYTILWAYRYLSICHHVLYTPYFGHTDTWAYVIMYCIHHTLGIQILEHMSSCTVYTILWAYRYLSICHHVLYTPYFGHTDNWAYVIMYCIHHTLGIQILEHMSSCTVYTILWAYR